MSEIVTAPDFVQPASIDFNALYQKAMDHPADPTVEAPASTPEFTSASADVVPAIPDTQLPQTSQAAPAGGQVVDLPDDALVRVKIDGVEQTVPYREYKDGIQREAAFTKRMQQLADQRREAEQVFTQRAAELQRQAEMLQYAQQQLQQQANPVAQLQQLLQQQQGGQTAPPSADPNEIATLGEVQQALKAFEQTFAQQQAAQQQAFLQQLQETGQQLKYEQALEADATTFTTALARTLDQDDYKVLRETIPFAEESIRFQVAQLNPQTMDEAISFMEQVAKEWSGKVRAASTEQLKRQEVAKARAKMEPPAGSPVPPVQARPKAVFKKNGQTDWDALRDRAAAYLDS
jgi:hypothetical protein